MNQTSYVRLAGVDKSLRALGSLIDSTLLRDERGSYWPSMDLSRLDEIRATCQDAIGSVYLAFPDSRRELRDALQRLRTDLSLLDDRWTPADVRTLDELRAVVRRERLDLIDVLEAHAESIEPTRTDDGERRPDADMAEHLIENRPDLTLAKIAEKSGYASAGALSGNKRLKALLAERSKRKKRVPKRGFAVPGGVEAIA